jgi:hypothetical protein
MFSMKTPTNKEARIEALCALLDECIPSSEKQHEWTDEDWKKEFRARDICRQLNTLR